jgi:hypothetical protein
MRFRPCGRACERAFPLHFPSSSGAAELDPGGDGGLGCVPWIGGLPMRFLCLLFGHIPGLVWLVYPSGAGPSGAGWYARICLRCGAFERWAGC